MIVNGFFRVFQRVNQAQFWTRHETFFFLRGFLRFSWTTVQARLFDCVVMVFCQNGMEWLVVLSIGAKQSGDVEANNTTTTTHNTQQHTTTHNNTQQHTTTTIIQSGVAPF